MSVNHRKRAGITGWLVLGLVLGIWVAGGAWASNLIEGRALVHDIDQAAQTMVLNGVLFRFNESTRFFDENGSRTSPSAIEDPKTVPGLPGAMLNPMGVTYEALDTGTQPLLTEVHVHPDGLD